MVEKTAGVTDSSSQSSSQCSSAIEQQNDSQTQVNLRCVSVILAYF